MKSGIQRLLETPIGSTVQYLMADEATWAKWAWSSEAELWQLVALHSHLDPDLLRSWAMFSSDVAALQATRTDHWAAPALAASLLRNVERAVHAVHTFDLPAMKLVSNCLETSLVSTAEFHGWTIRASLAPVSGFPGRVRLPNGRYPWGNYSTPCIEKVAAACELWRLVADGGKYDLAKPWTAPRPEEFKAKLVEVGVSNWQIKTLATITRDPRLRLGRRASPPKDD